MCVMSTVVTSESAWTKLTSKPSIPSNLQELLDSLFMAGYIPEYILPEDKLTETEKTEGEYLDFPDLKKAQDDVFVPQESGYSKNNLHYKNIKGHKRLISDKSWRSENEPDTWDGLWSPYVGPDDLRLDLIAHLMENFTGKDMGQDNNSEKLDFLIPIPEKGTYSPNETTTFFYTIPSTEQPMFANNNLPSTLKQNFSITRIPSPKQNQPVPSAFQNLFTIKYSESQTISPPKLYFQNVKQPKTDFRMKDMEPPLSAQISQFPTTEKQHGGTMLSKLQLVSTTQQPQFVLARQQHQSILILQHLPSASLQTMTDRSEHGMAQVEQHKTTKKSKAITDDNNIEVKAVSLRVNTPRNDEIQININQNTTLKDDSLIYNSTIPNIETKFISQNNLSSYGPVMKNHAVQVIENIHQVKNINVTKKPKNKMLTFFNIFKKNNKKPILPRVSPQARNISLQANSLVDVYNQLTETNMVQLYNELEKESLILQHENEQGSNHKRKKK